MISRKSCVHSASYESFLKLPSYLLSSLDVKFEALLNRVAQFLVLHGMPLMLHQSARGKVDAAAK